MGTRKRGVGEARNPVARQIDGVAVALVHGGHAASGVGAVEGIAGVLAFERDGEFLPARAEATEYCIYLLAIHDDVRFRDRV